MDWGMRKQSDFYCISFRRLEMQHGYNTKNFNLKLVTDEFLNRLRCWSSCPTVAFPQHYFCREPPKIICYIPRNPFPSISSETRLQRGNWQYTDYSRIACCRTKRSPSILMWICRIVNGTSKFISQFIAEPVTMFYATLFGKLSYGKICTFWSRTLSL